MIKTKKLSSSSPRINMRTDQNEDGLGFGTRDLRHEATQSKSFPDHDSKFSKTGILKHKCTRVFLVLQLASFFVLYALFKADTTSCRTDPKLGDQLADRINDPRIKFKKKFDPAHPFQMHHNIHDQSNTGIQLSKSGDITANIERPAAVSTLSESVGIDVEYEKEESEYENKTEYYKSKVRVYDCTVDAREVILKENNFNDRSDYLSRIEILNRTRHQKARFIHIPKTGGTAVKNDAQILFQKGSKSQLGLKALQVNGAFHFSLFRDPRHHIYSQFLHCKYNPYGKQRDYTNFPKTTKDPAGDEVDFEKWLNHFDSASFNLKTSTAWNCYNPFNMQSRYMTSNCKTYKACHTSKNWPLQPSLVDAIKAVESLDWFGITEYYHESICLLSYQLTAALPESCDCTNSGSSKGLHKEFKHALPLHDVRKLSLRIKRKIDHISVVDRALYNHAKDILIARLVRLEKLTGTTVLCRQKHV